MRTYSYVKMVVDGKATSELDVYRQHNTFEIYEHDINVFSGSYSGAIQYIEGWKEKAQELRNLLEAAGHFVTYEQTIR